MNSVHSLRLTRMIRMTEWCARKNLLNFLFAADKNIQITRVVLLISNDETDCHIFKIATYFPSSYQQLKSHDSKLKLMSQTSLLDNSYRLNLHISGTFPRKYSNLSFYLQNTILFSLFHWVSISTLLNKNLGEVK